MNLGLTSGLKWAACNVGANCPEDGGDYFAWGETSPKYDYSWETYKWCDGSNKTLTKYNSDSAYGMADNKTQLELSDDAANVNWGGNWRTPTYDEWNELRRECTWLPTTQNGKNGYLVTGPNGNSIFLPIAGRMKDTGRYSTGYGFYWSSSIDHSYSALYRSFSYSGGVSGGGSSRCFGHTVRPVIE